MLRTVEERDAFGRERSEDPLAEMGWSSADAAERESAAAGVPEPAPAPAPEETGPVSISMPGAPATPTHAGTRRAPVGIPGRRRRPNALGCVFPLVVLVFIGAVLAVVVPAIIDAVDTVDEVRDGLDEGGGIPGGDGSGGGDATRRGRPPAGFARGSLLRRENLAPALARLRRVTRSNRIDQLRVAADRVDVIAQLGGGRRRIAQATWDGDATVLATTPSGGTGTGTFPWSRVDAAAPQRVARFATRGRSPSSFAYLVLIDAAGLRWSAFLENGTHFDASPDGRRVRRVSG
ncbi:MAG TPA: hypothetical protein VHF89_19170 [Solirubrobacteraceae bacterium]|nr:hypothetical protein [Solirubrobacteraceae bacterium]